MAIYLELSVVLLLTVTPALVGCFSKKEFLHETKSHTSTLLINVYYSAGLILLLLYIGLQQQTELISIGIDIEKTDFLVTGILLASIFVLLYAGINNIIKKLFLKNKGKSEENKWEQNFRSVQGPLNRSLLLAFVSLAAISEELIYRGYFILIWGQRTNHPTICAAISGIIFIILHLNRGKKFIPYYVAITVFLTIPTLYANNILISIGMHVYINLLATAAIWIRKRKKLKRPETKIFDQEGFLKPEITPCSTPAILLLVGSFIAIPFSFFSFGAPSIIIIVLAICEIIRVKKSQGKIAGIGCCIVATFISTLPILAIAAFFALPYVLDWIFPTVFQ